MTDYSCIRGSMLVLVQIDVLGGTSYIPYSGKFSHSAKFHDFTDRLDAVKISHYGIIMFFPEK